MIVKPVKESNRQVKAFVAVSTIPIVVGQHKDGRPITKPGLEDKTSWEKELKVESVIESLSELEKSEDGKVVCVGLKLKYWAGISYQELFGNISLLKNKSEVSQRFYFFEGQTGISVDEAYRFLQNRWLEKQMQAKRKEPVSNNEEELTEEEHTSSGNGLLQKKRLSIPKRANKKNSTLKK